MPAVRNYPRQTNPQAFDAGLIIQSRTEIETNPAGLEQGTLTFLCRNELMRKFRPARATPCSEFIAGDDLTTRILRSFDYLGCQSKGFTRDGDSPGIGLLRVLCQGAIFDITDGVYPEYDPAGISIGTPGSGGIESPHRGHVIRASPITFKFRDKTGLHNLSVGYVKDDRTAQTLFTGNFISDTSVTVAGFPIDGHKVYANYAHVKNGVAGIGQSYIWDTAAPSTGDNGEDAGASFGPITTPLFESDSTQQTVTIPVVSPKDFTYLGPDFNASAYMRDAIIDYHALDLHYEYVAERRSHRPRFLQSSYDWDGDPASPVIVPDGTTGGTEQLQILIDKVTLAQGGVSDYIADFFADELYNRITDPLAHWQDVVSLVGTGAQFKQAPAGKYFHVLETAQIQISPNG